MLVLLPPSETKRAGGVDGTRLDFAALSFPELTAQRRAVVDSLQRLSRNLGAAAGALRLGGTQGAEVARNRAIRTSPVLPAIDRYEGVLYEGLDVSSLSDEERKFAGRHVAIASAAFGLTGALDPIPAYRLSHDSRLPGLSLPKVWRDPIAAVLAATDGLILDVRSEAYARLGPMPTRPDTFFVRVVSDDANGRRRALNHFNKKGKGEFVRRLLRSSMAHPNADSLLAWAADEQIDLHIASSGELELVV